MNLSSVIKAVRKEVIGSVRDNLKVLNAHRGVSHDPRSADDQLAPAKSQLQDSGDVFIINKVAPACTPTAVTINSAHIRKLETPTILPLGNRKNDVLTRHVKGGDKNKAIKDHRIIKVATNNTAPLVTTGNMKLACASDVHPTFNKQSSLETSKSHQPQSQD